MNKKTKENTFQKILETLNLEWNSEAEKNGSVFGDCPICGRRQYFKLTKNTFQCHNKKENNPLEFTCGFEGDIDDLAKFLGLTHTSKNTKQFFYRDEKNQLLLKVELNSHTGKKSYFEFFNNTWIPKNLRTPALYNIEDVLKSNHVLFVDTEEMAHDLSDQFAKEKIPVAVTTNAGGMDFQEYYESLTSWDGITDYITMLAGTITFADESEAVRFFIALKKFLVGVVATTMGSRPTDLGLFFASLDGGQGKGKTTWLHHLSPQKLRERYHSIGRVNFMDKDSYVQLSEYMFLQLDEFDQYTKYEASIIKNFMTQRYINIRRHYGKGFGVYPRMASFLGSLNKSRFLTDDTGNRRYLIFVPTAFENKGSHDIDMDKVYAQAFGLWQGGFRYWLNQTEIDELNDINKQFIIGSMEEAMLENYYRLPIDNDDESKIKKLQTFELVEALMNKAKQEIDSQKVTKALYRLGYEKKSSRVDGDPRRVWFLVER